MFLQSKHLIFVHVYMVLKSFLVFNVCMLSILHISNLKVHNKCIAKMMRFLPGTTML